jgi:hypothetical protein
MLRHLIESSAPRDRASAPPSWVSRALGAACFGLALSTLLPGCGGGGGTETATDNTGTANRAPVSEAGAAQSVMAGTQVTLNGSASSDPDRDSLIYRWTWQSRPAGSTAVLAGASTDMPRFTPDLAGTYVVSLVVNDGRLDSPADTVNIVASVGNAAPVAHAGAAQKQLLRSTIALDGSASTDANGDALTYRWTLTSRPAGSQAVLSSASAAKPTFVADQVGVYTASLIASDGRSGGVSAPATVTVTVVPVFGYAGYKFSTNETTVFYPALSYNVYTGDSTGISVSRFEKGSFQVDFEHLGRADGKYTVLVTNVVTVGADPHSRCVANRPEVRGTSLRANVLCLDHGGAPLDTGFTVLVLGEQALKGPNVVARALPSGTLRSVAASGDATATHSVLNPSPGNYVVRFDRMPVTAGTRYTPFVGASASFDKLCSGTPYSEQAELGVVCQDMMHNPGPAEFNFALVTSGRDGRAFTMLTADQISTPSYTPFNVVTTQGKSPTVTHRGRGSYEVKLPGLATQQVARKAVIVSPYGNIDGLGCNVAGNSPLAEGDTDLIVQVQCYGYFNGVDGAFDTPFNLMVLE